MKFGIEHEVFILKKNNEALDHTEQKEFFSILIEYGYMLKINDDLIIAKQRNDNMDVEISNDFCTHIFELRFSPTENLSVFHQNYKRAINDLQQICKLKNLLIVDSSVIDSIPKTYYVVSQSDKNGLRMQKILDRNSNSHIMFEKSIMSFVTSTQIHLDWDFATFPNVKNLYNFEYLFPLLFSNSKSFKGLEFHCVRPILYKSNFLNYNLVAFPERIPESFFELSEYSKVKNFIRDYSFISLRSDFNTIEFRGTCSHNSIEVIKQILSLRIAIIKTVNLNISGYKSIRHDYYNTCINGKYDKTKLFNDFQILNGIEIEKQYKANYNAVLEKIKKLL